MTVELIMRRAWAVMLALLASFLPIVATAPAAAADPQVAASGHEPVVVVGVPDLCWQDVTEATTPTLWRLAQTAAVAAMTDRSGEPITRRATGWITLNSGTRARADVDPTVVPDPTNPAQLEALRAANAGAAYRAQVGALGNVLHREGLKTAAVGAPGALLGPMAADGRVDATAPSVADALTEADVVVVELPQLYGIDRRDPIAVQGALAGIDDAVNTILGEVPGGASLLLAGVSEAATGPAHLHVAIATGPSFEGGELTSASTGRDGVVQLIDVAPTVLSLVGAPVPPAMPGAPWQVVSQDAGVATARTIAGFVDLDDRSVIVRASGRWYYPAVAGTALLYVAITLICWRRRRSGGLRTLGAIVAAVPLAGFLMQVLPWWRAGSWPQLPLTAGIAAALGLSASFLPWARRNRWGTAAILGATTVVVLAADAATGSPLSLDAPFADNPIIAGRFHGLGNVAFALLGAGTLVLSAAVAAGRRPRPAAAAVCALGVVGLVVDGLPSLGDDFGGVLALLPAVAVLAITVSRVRVLRWHVVSVVAAAVLTTMAFAVYDFSRPATERTHLGRFIAQVGDGSAATVVHRKLDTSLGTFSAGWGRWIVLGWVALALASWIGHRRGRLRLAEGMDAREVGGLLAALVTLAVLGAAVNDSGLEITAFTFYLAAPLLIPFLDAHAATPPTPEGTQPGRVVATSS
jgi:hypothetical protein